MAVAMDLSLFLAKILGLYLIIAIAACAFRWRELKRAMEDFGRSRGLVLIGGIWALLLGLLLVVSHNIWEPNFRGVITFLGWMTLLKGLVYLFLPQSIGKIRQKILETSLFAVLLGVFFLLGAWLAATGFGVNIYLP